MWHSRATRVLTVLFLTAVAVSIVHYVDNYVNYGDYPRSSGPSPSAGVILGAWFVFTAAGVWGYVLFRRAPSDRALLLLAFYSGSGLVGIGHYTVAGATSMPWWRQGHVLLDIACGAALLTFVVWSVRRRSLLRAASPRDVE